MLGRLVVLRRVARAGGSPARHPVGDKRFWTVSSRKDGIRVSAGRGSDAEAAPVLDRRCGTAALLRAAFLGWLHPPPLARDAQARNPDPTENPKEICEGKGRDDLVFPGENGHHLRLARVHEDNMSWFGSAVKRTGIPRITPHDLRHSAASFAVSSGANVKVVQKMLGHSSAAMTLDTYADLLDGDLDSVSDALDHAVSLANVPRMCPRV